MTTPDERLLAAVRQNAGLDPNAEALAKLGDAARAELKAHPKARPWWWGALLLFVLQGVLAIVAARAWPFAQTQHRSEMLSLLIGGCWLVLMTVSAVWWLKPGSNGPRRVLMGSFAGLSVLTLLATSGFDPGGPFMDGMQCAIAECELAVIPLVLGLAFSLRFAAQPSHLALAALSASSGGALVLHFHCGNGTVAHLAVFHLLPALVLAGLAVGVRRLFRPGLVP